jgi:hypothetical protein
MKDEIYGHLCPVSTHCFSAAKSCRDRHSVRGFLATAAQPFRPIYTNASAVSAGAGPYFSGAIVKLALPWLTLRTAAE